MTKERQTQLILQVWQKKLRRREEIPEHLVASYKKWLLAQIENASSQITAVGQAQQQAQLDQAMQGGEAKEGAA